MGATTRQAAAARDRDQAVRWTREVTGTGLCEPLGAGRFLLTVPLDDLAVHLGYARRSGSLARRLRRAEAAGLLASRRPVIFQLPVDDASHAQAPSEAPADSAEILRFDEPVAHATGTSAPADVLVLLARLADDAFREGSVDVAARALDALCAVAQRRPSEPPSGGIDAKDPGSFSPPDAAGRALRAVEKKTSSLSSSATPSAAPDHARHGWPGPVATAPPAPASGGNLPGRAPRRPAGSDGALDPREKRAQRVRIGALLAPLLEECARRGLPGISGRAGVVSALAPLSDDEIRRGVHMVCTQIAAGTQVRSPVGLLVTLARRGDLVSDEPPAVVSAAVVSPPVRPTRPEDAGEWLGVVSALMRENLGEESASSPDGVEGRQSTS